MVRTTGCERDAKKGGGASPVGAPHRLVEPIARIIEAQCDVSPGLAAEVALDVLRLIKGFQGDSDCVAGSDAETDCSPRGESS